MYFVSGGPSTRIAYSNGGLTIGGIPRLVLHPRGSLKFQLADIPVYLAFQPGADGRYRLITDALGVPPSVAERTEPASLHELSEYEGKYRNDDLGQAYSVRRNGSALTIAARDGRESTLVPTYLDGVDWSVRGFAVVFQRAASGRVTSLLVSTGTERTSPIRFLRSRDSG